MCHVKTGAGAEVYDFDCVLQVSSGVHSKGQPFCGAASILPLDLCVPGHPHEVLEGQFILEGLPLVHRVSSTCHGQSPFALWSNPQAEISNLSNEEASGSEALSVGSAAG